ncbi:MAG: ATP-dependent helicase [Chloroflexi bacterium]|nr:ATP-dependent helicase [Chloroflexota bacterium]
MSPIPLQSFSGIHDNFYRGKVGDFLKAKIAPGSSLSVVSAYFTIYAYSRLKAQLDQIAGLRFLFGEPGFLRGLDPNKDEAKVFAIREDGLALQNHLEQKRVARECAEWVRAKAEIHSVRRANFLHAKLYHIASGDKIDAILGSSNFTVRGLGLGDANNNIELNLEVNDRRDLQDLKAWFDQLWLDEELTTDVKDEVLKYLAQLYQNHAPQFIYFKTLFHLFEKQLADRPDAPRLDERAQIVQSQVWNALFPFQKDGVKGAINKLLRHNGCIIADSVGLGKTYEALAIIKYFELLNQRALVLCPKKLRENWTIYQTHTNSALNPFPNDRFGYTVLSHTDLSRESGKAGDIDLATFNWGAYDLVVIDESHNFRNNAPGVSDEDGNLLRKSRYRRLVDNVIKAGGRTKVLLLSATPVNNDLRDLRNQIYLMSEGRDDAFKDSLGIPHLGQMLKTAQGVFTEWAKQPQRTTEQLLERLNSAFFTLLDELTIARSRKHVQTYYAADMARIGGFPKREKPLSIFPTIDRDGEFMPYDRLNDEIVQYKLSLFNPFTYVRPEYRGIYERVEKQKGGGAFRQSQREQFLIGMMKVNFLKRLESSVYSFGITMGRTVDKIKTLQEKLRAFQRVQGGELDLNDYVEALDDEDVEAVQEALEVGKKAPYKLEHLDIPRWLGDLQADLDKLANLQLEAQKVKPQRDAKLAELKRLIVNKVKHPSTNKDGNLNRKALVFTAFADTASYLYEHLHAWAKRELGIETAMVSGGAGETKTTFGKNEFSHILTNFAPRSKQRSKVPAMPQAGEIDLLIGTDCISEGQNLQDCDTVINYDIHWNPVRVIQRFGRIDRIGSVAPTVQLVNFWPTRDLDHYINLKARVEARMALVDIAATQDDNLLNVEELVKEDLHYRDKQLLRLKDEVLDLEDFKENVSLTEFTLDGFRRDLSNYLQANRKALEEAPLGLYAVAPPEPSEPRSAPGVIFCLRQKGETGENTVVNPLQPHFLVYVRGDDIAYTFAQPKQILEIYRQLCEGKTQPLDALCEQFDTQTQNGADMSAYDALLRKAVTAITKTFRKRNLNALQAGRGGVLAPRSQQVTETSDFELVTWLVVM